LSEYRTDSYWARVYDNATKIANVHNITVTIEVTTRKRRIPAHLNESVVYENIGLRETPSVSEDYKVRFYFPVLDKFLYELKRRFNNHNIPIIIGIAACTPTAFNFLSIADLETFAQMYGIQVNQPTLEVEVSYLKAFLTSTVDSLVSFRSYLYSSRSAYNILYQLTHIALTIAVTSAESERSFSALKRIKTRLRSRMRLSALTVLSIEKEIAQKLDYDTIIVKHK
jgi:hypothetical protein